MERITTFNVAGWTLVFKTIAGESGPIQNIWKDSLSINENSLEALNKDNYFRHHYKNSIVQDWKIFNPNQVYYKLFCFLAYTAE
jgi:hypothetical protein